MVLSDTLRLIAGVVLVLLSGLSVDDGHPAQPSVVLDVSSASTLSTDSVAQIHLPFVSGGIGGINQPPVAADDSYQMSEDMKLVVTTSDGVLANDSDPQQGVLRAVLVSEVAHGELDLHPDGSFDYLPEKDFNGQDSFAYRATNIDTESEVATVNIELAPVNDPPHIVTGEHSFTTEIIGTGVKAAHAVVAADFDGDGDIDAAATDYKNGQVRWFENDGAGVFASHILDPNLEGAYPAHVGDVDGDGDADILAAGYLADTFAWYQNNGGGDFMRRDIDTSSDGAHSIVASDLDQDGDMDLVTASQDANTIAWYENDGAENFTRFIVDESALGAKRAEVADLDGDGDLDIVLASAYDDVIAWLENNGNQEFTKRVIDETADGAYFVNPADVDGDGDMDVFSASQLDNTIALYRNDGAGNFTFELIDDDALGARSVIAVDLDRDGDMDALTTSREDDTVAWFVNDGTGTFSQQIIDDAANGAYGVFAIDVDFDGNLDVLSASRMSGKIALYRHVLTQVASVVQGGEVTIDSAVLLTTDVDNDPDELVYTITAAPEVGELRLNGVALMTGGTFSQADVNDGLVVYVHDGLDDPPVEFNVEVSDGGVDEAMAMTCTIIVEVVGSASR